MFVPGQVGDGVKLGGGKTVGLVLSLVLVIGLGLDLDLEEVRQSVHVDMLIALAPADCFRYTVSQWCAATRRPLLGLD